MKIYCKNKGHEKEEVVAYCIDPFCKTINKFVCMECLCENHSQHKIKRIEGVLENLIESIENNNLLEKNNASKNELEKIQQLMEAESDILKEHIDKCLKESFETIFNNAKEKINKFEKKFSTFIDWENFLNDNKSTTVENDE